jgi:hypothetical protein
MSACQQSTGGGNACYQVLTDQHIAFITASNKCRPAKYKPAATGMEGLNRESLAL